MIVALVAGVAMMVLASMRLPAVVALAKHCPTTVVDEARAAVSRQLCQRLAHLLCQLRSNACRRSLYAGYAVTGEGVETGYSLAIGFCLARFTCGLPAQDLPVPALPAGRCRWAVG